MVAGSITSQRISTVGSSKKGSMNAVAASGMRIMSDSLMPFHPAMEEPSNILPSRNRSSSTSRAGIVTCCSLPRVSVKRRSANFTCFSLMSLRTSVGVISPPGKGCISPRRRRSFSGSSICVPTGSASASAGPVPAPAARRIKQLGPCGSHLCTMLVRNRYIIAPHRCARQPSSRSAANLPGHLGASARFWCSHPVATARTVYSRALWGLNAHAMKIGRAPRTFQELIFALQHYWSRQGCVILEPYDMEVGAGTFHTATFLRAVGPEPWRAAYVQPSRRPTDGRYGENPFRLQHYYQYQVAIKPSPLPILNLYLGSLEALGLDPLVHDVRFVEDNWESPTLGAWGLGWEVWLNGMEITQFTYFQQVGGLDCRPVTGEITYGLERLAMYLQGVESIYDILWAEGVDGPI